MCKGCCKLDDSKKRLVVKNKTKVMMLSAAVAWQRPLLSEAQLNSCVNKFLCKQVLLPDQAPSKQPATLSSVDTMVRFVCVLTQALLSHRNDTDELLVVLIQE